VKDFKKEISFNLIIRRMIIKIIIKNRKRKKKRSSRWFKIVSVS